MVLQKPSVQSAFSQGLDQGDPAAGRFPLVTAEGIGRAVGETVAAFNAAISFGDDLFRRHDQEVFCESGAVIWW